MAASTAARRQQMLQRMAGASSCIGRKHGGGGMLSIILRALLRWAGTPWIPLLDQLWSVQNANGLCHRTWFTCQDVPDVCGRCVTWMVFAFAFVDFCGYRHAVNCRWKLWSSSLRWAACALVRSACSARSSLETAFVSGGGQCRPWCQNACTMQPQRARLA